MNVVAISASPRQGSNSNVLIDEAIKALGVAESDAKKYVINDLQAIGCQACYSCKTKTEYCVVKDEMAPVLSAVASADFVVFASPVYIGDLTAQAKIFIDRSFSWLKPDFRDLEMAGRLAPGKKLLFLVTQGDPDLGTYEMVVTRYLEYFRWLGFKAGAVHGADLNQKEAAKSRLELLAEVRAKAKELAMA
ncbi:MAG: flavodoxin family protein [Deltaproteobacteria bacterium]|jgi:multimeric flavodoxin WrbA|nr:flavodoxin family protein [Deltaproteobacteria bacterium]